MSVVALDPGFILAEAARLRETTIKDKSYQQTPIGALAKRYLDGLAFENYSPKTVDERERVLACLALDFAHLTPAEIVDAHLRDFLSHWKDSAVNYRRSLVSTIRVFFEWAHENDHVPTNPARRIKTPKAKDEDSRRRSYARKVVRQLVNAQPLRRDRLALLLMYWLALRRDELRQVQVGDFDFFNRVLTVHGKGGTILDQHLAEPIAREIEAYFMEIQAEPAWFLLTPQNQVRRGTYPLYSYELVPRDPSEPYSLSGISRWFQNCRKRAGLPDIVMHELRHTAGTHFHIEGHDLIATQHFMRHKDPATTARTYVHLDRIRAVADVQRTMLDPLEGESE